MRRGLLMYANMKFRMRQRDRYECNVPHPLPLDGKYHMFCSRENIALDRGNRYATALT